MLFASCCLQKVNDDVHRVEDPLHSAGANVNPLNLNTILDAEYVNIREVVGH